MNELMNKWTIWRVNEWMNEWMNEWLNEWMNEGWVEQIFDKKKTIQEPRGDSCLWKRRNIHLTNEWMNEWMNDYMNEWMNECTNCQKC